MNTAQQRYIFTDFDSIQRVKFKKLEKVCDKIFILINSSDDLIPFFLVRNLQKLGKAVKWISIENNQNLTLNYHICYLIGKMHSKISKDIEFAILSDDDVFDSMILYINENDRHCRRVATGAPKTPPKPKTKSKPKRKSSKLVEQIVTRKADVRPTLVEGERAEKDAEREFVPFAEPQESLVAYRETKDRLKLVATRPYNVTSLRDYIHINNQELVERGKLDVEEIITMMELNDEINIRGGVVGYNF